MPFQQPSRGLLIVVMATGLSSTGLTLTAADWNDPASAFGIWLFAAVGVWPYAFAVLLASLSEHQKLLRAWAVTALGPYALFDLWARYTALHSPQSSTDALVVVALPIFWAPGFYVTAGLLVVVLSAVTGAFRR